MSIHWRCGCGKSLKAPDGSGGRKAKCPACGQVNVVPLPAVEEENEGLEVLDEGPPPIPEVPPVPPPPVPARAVSRGVVTPPPPPVPVSEADRVSDDDDWGEYDLKEEEPKPVAPVRRPMAVAPVGRTPVNVGAMTPPPYRPAAVEEEDDDTPELIVRNGRTWRDFTYLALLLAMIPLILITFKKEESLLKQIARSVKAHPEIAEKYKQIVDAADAEDTAETTDAEESDDSEDGDAQPAVVAADPRAVIEALPEHRLEGALLERRSAGHWLIALGSAAVFLTVMIFLFDGLRDAQPLGLLLCGLFTGTVGVVLLLLLQLLANIALGMGLRLRFISWKLLIFILLIKFIGFSYYAADNPRYGFLASFFGYTFGVGLCEELCKMLPVMWLMTKRPEQVSWRVLCKWGLASGVGFGVAEGIIYSSRYYNGIVGMDVYLMRFSSCVALHAVWSASFAIAMYLSMDKMAKQSTTGGTLRYAALAAAMPMILHGLYDTLLKKDMGGGALIVALVSFMYLAALIEWSLRKKDLTMAAPRGRAALA